MDGFSGKAINLWRLDSHLIVVGSFGKLKAILLLYINPSSSGLFCYYPQSNEEIQLNYIIEAISHGEASF